MLLCVVVTSPMPSVTVSSPMSHIGATSEHVWADSSLASLIMPYCNASNFQHAVMPDLELRPTFRKMEHITVKLVDEELWKLFNPDIEMIVTKRGRSIFPKLDYYVSGLDPNAYYVFQLKMERVDDIKYRFDQGVWHEASRGEPRVPETIIRHSEGFRRGEEWMKTTVSFHKAKITNNPADVQPLHILVQSMHKYIPVLIIIKMGSTENGIDVPAYQQEFRFPSTQFIAVTAYQNHRITQLKVKHNKYARGYRTENGLKRQRADASDEDNSRPAKIAAPAIPPNSHMQLIVPPPIPDAAHHMAFNQVPIGGPPVMLGQPVYSNPATPPEENKSNEPEANEVNAQMHNNFYGQYPPFDMAAYYAPQQGYGYNPQQIGFGYHCNSFPSFAQPFDPRIEISPDSSYHSP
ncbi:unnamed protein product [Caenorhabditis bovis]|uniref:T-box domain-containing protein n=1 Tax=Caenorhabditis bovis TaxID=2654633 RepID=A0A8S1EEM9_9PELO|nr:unnamed protein product [Caenorhabditis bovis]